MPFSCAERERKASLMTRKSEVRNQKSGRSPNSEFPKDDCPAPIFSDSTFGIRISFGLRPSDFGFESVRRKALPEGAAHGSCQSPPKIVSQRHGPDVSFRLSALPLPGVRFRRRRHRPELRRPNHSLSRLPATFRCVHPPPTVCRQQRTCSRQRPGQVRSQAVAHRYHHTAAPAVGKCVGHLRTDTASLRSGEAMVLGRCKTGLSRGPFASD